MIYFDHASSSPILPESMQVLKEYCEDCFGNAGAAHRIGRKADRAKEEARKKILDLLGLTKTHNLIFTSGATEANNMAIKGIAFNYQNRGKRIISSNGEHASVFNTVHQLGEYFGFDVHFIDNKNDGAIYLDELKSLINNETILLSFMSVNNETGAKNDLKGIIDIKAKYPKCFLHVDITQSLGKITFPYENIDILTASSHKFGGPKGVGILLFRKNITFLPLLSGGDQEGGLRGGTENVPGIMAMAKALEISLAKQPTFLDNCKKLRERLNEYLTSHPDLYEINSPLDGVPYLFNFSLKLHKASVILEALSQKGICVSSISACAKKKDIPSKALLAAGFDEERSSNALRVSFGKDNTMEEMETFISTLDSILKEVRHR